MTMLSNGSVGIGTTSPQSTLDVNGDIRISGTSIQGYLATVLCAARGTAPYGGGGEVQSYTVAGPSVGGTSGSAKCSALGKSCYLAFGGVGGAGMTAVVCWYGYSNSNFYACCQ